MALPDHFDARALAQLQELMGEEFPLLVKVFTEDSARRLVALNAAVSASDSQHVRELAHSFKGASSNISAMPLAQLLQQLEYAGSEHRLHDARDLLSRVEHEFSLVAASLRTLVS